MGKDLSDREIRELLVRDSREGWRVFINQFTPGMLAVIEHAGVRRHDDAMDVYVRVCDHLAADDCARLRRHDPGKGALGAWLTVVIRRVIVDWLRSQKGRRRLFKSIEKLEPLDQRVFELRYWQRKGVNEIVELAARDLRRPLTLSDVFESLDRIERSMSDRQRADLLSLMAREGTAASLDDEPVAATVSDPVDDPEQQVRKREFAAAVRAVLSQLAPEDALIVAMLYIDGLSRKEVERALHISALTVERTEQILARLRNILAARGLKGSAS